MAGAVVVGAVDEFAYNVNRPRHREDAVVAVVADVHVALTRRAAAILPDQLKSLELDALGPVAGHGNLLLSPVT